jgi:hypothetical protein
VLTCRGTLVLYAKGEGECDLGRECDVYEHRWTEHDAYLAAHRHRVLPDQAGVTSRPASHGDGPAIQ